MGVVGDRAGAHGWPTIASVQNLYNLADRRREEVLDYAARRGHRLRPVGSRLAAAALAQRGRSGPAGSPRRLGATPAQVALAWLLALSARWSCRSRAPPRPAATWRRTSPPPSMVLSGDQLAELDALCAADRHGSDQSRSTRRRPRSGVQDSTTSLVASALSPVTTTSVMSAMNISPIGLARLPGGHRTGGNGPPGDLGLARPLALLALLGVEGRAVQGEAGVPLEVRPLAGTGHRTEAQVALGELALDPRDAGRAVGPQRGDRLVATGVESLRTRPANSGSACSNTFHAGTVLERSCSSRCWRLAGRGEALQAARGPRHQAGALPGRSRAHEL